MSTRKVLITGCSSGFGQGLVREFLSRGWTVAATMRNAEARRGIFSEELSRYPGRLDVLELDVTSADHRSRISEWVGSNWQGELHCLINNAGYGLFGALEDLSEQQLRDQFEVNFFGAAFLTRRLLPFLRRGRGCVLNVSSVVGFFGTPLSCGYSSSKYALEGLSESISHELAGVEVGICLLEPGSFGTSFRDNARWGENSPIGKESESAYGELSKRIHEYRVRTRKSAKDENIVVGKIVSLAEKAAKGGRLPLRVRVGADAHSVHLAKKLLPESWFLRILRLAMRRMGLA